jgi:hypothetical protein
MVMVRGLRGDGRQKSATRQETNKIGLQPIQDGRKQLLNKEQQEKEMK